MAELDEVLLEPDLVPSLEEEAGPEGIIGHRNQMDADTEAGSQLAGHHAEAGSLGQALSAVAVGGQVFVAQIEPRHSTERAERFHDPPGLPGQTPSCLGVDGTGEGVHHRVQVRGDVQAVEVGVVADVDDGGDVIGGHHIDHPAQETCRSYATSQGGDHAVIRSRMGRVTIGAGYPDRWPP